MSGASLKLLGNSCILGTIELFAETFALADSIDFDPAIFQDFIGKSISRLFQRMTQVNSKTR